MRERIKQYYGQDATSIIYPPVDIHPYQRYTQKDYFLVVSRLVPYKRIDLIIDAFNELKLPLVIIGSGMQKRLLQERASATISFVSEHLTDAELSSYYGSCRAFLSAADEDFGIAAAEAQATGKPVITYKESGTAEIVTDGKTGILFYEQYKESIIGAVRRFQKMKIRPDNCRESAECFSKQRFIKEMREGQE